MAEKLQSPKGAATAGAKMEPKGNLYQSRGPATEFSDTKYNIKQLSYPKDLMSPIGEYGGNYVIFYINVASDSKLFNQGKDVNGNPVETVADISPRDRGDLIALDLTKTQLTATSGAKTAVAGLVGGSIALDSPGKGLAVAAIATVGVGVTANLAASTTRQQRRLKTAIALHTPNQLQIRYGAQWSDEDTAGFAMTQGVAGEIIKALSSGGKNSDVTGAAQGAVANLALTKGPDAAAVSNATGLAANPKKEQVFKGVDFRTFSFEYQFYPRDADEASNVLAIMKELKYHMHPEFKDAKNFVYLYPSEFDIYYYNGHVENLNLHRHTSCVLTDLSINYTPNGSFAAFSDGMPTQINVSMTFKELALLTKDKIKDGM